MVYVVTWRIVYSVDVVPIESQLDLRHIEPGVFVVIRFPLLDYDVFLFPSFFLSFSRLQ